MHSGKRLLCFTLAMTTAIPLMFTGCKSGTSSKAATKTKKMVTLSLFTGDKQIQGLDRITKEVNSYLKKKNTGLQIKWQTMSWDSLGKKTNTMLQTGQEADIINTASWIGAGYRSHAANGYLTDLTKYINASENKDVVDIIGKDFLDGTKINGKYYAMPTNKEKAHNFGFLVRTDLVKKYGVDTSKIKSIEDMEPYFAKAKADGVTPICAAKMDHPFKFLDWDVISDDGTPGALDPSTDESKIVDQFTEAKSVAFFKKMKEYNQKGYFSANASTADSEETEMKSGKYFCGSWSLMPGKDKSESISLGMDLTQIYITPTEKSNRETLGALLAIPKTSKHPDEAFKFIKMLYTDKTLINLMIWGQEGTDYTKKSDNTIELNSKTDYTSAGGWIMGNQFNNYLTTTQSATLYDDIEKYNDSAKALTSLGFIFDPTSVSDQFGACQNTITKYYPQLFYGTCSNVDTTVAAMAKELKADGEADLLKEMQTQYDKWKSSK